MTLQVWRSFGEERIKQIQKILEKNGRAWHVEANADLEARDNNHETALLAACRTENSAVVKVLLKRGADVNALRVCGQNSVQLLCNRNLDALCIFERELVQKKHG